MPSFGESDIMMGVYRVGTLRLQSLRSGSAVYPRLMITAGCALQDVPKEHPGTLELVDLTGEVRLQESQDAIGSLQWLGPRKHIRSSQWLSEDQLHLYLDLDHSRLEYIPWLFTG